MKRLILIIWFLIAQLSSTFGQSTPDSAAFRYYKFLAKQQIDVSLKLIKLDNYLSDYSERAEKYDSFMLGRERFDTLANLFYETATMVNKAVFDIIDLHEVDSIIGLKEPVLFLFRGYARMLGDYYPIFLSLLQNKGKVYSSDEVITFRNTHKRFITLMKDLNVQIDVIESASSEFLIKYNITEYDILKDGS